MNQLSTWSSAEAVVDSIYHVVDAHRADPVLVGHLNDDNNVWKR